jgi:hypothetical protein
VVREHQEDLRAQEEVEQIILMVQLTQAVELVVEMLLDLELQ